MRTYALLLHYTIWCLFIFWYLFFDTYTFLHLLQNKKILIFIYSIFIVLNFYPYNETYKFKSINNTYQIIFKQYPKNIFWIISTFIPLFFVNFTFNNFSLNLENWWIIYASIWIFLMLLCSYQISIYNSLSKKVLDK